MHVLEHSCDLNNKLTVLTNEFSIIIVICMSHGEDFHELMYVCVQMPRFYCRRFKIESIKGNN